MKKLFYSIIAVLIFSIYLIGKDMPVRPENVPENAKWNEIFKNWSIKGKYSGEIKIWFQDGHILTETKLINEKKMKEIDYNNAGKISLIGQHILLENKFKKGDSKYEWQPYGKWKEYNKEGVLKREICYTQVFDAEDGYWKAEYCGEEINYNDDGTVKEKIQHKRKCDYGCEELECKDCIKK